MPNLIVVDGNAIQMNVVENLLKMHKFSIPVVGVVKDERHRPKDILGPERLIKEHKNGILLANSESHRFAITFHRSKRKIV
jgi:excinuclease ABC subunit C